MTRHTGRQHTGLQSVVNWLRALIRDFVIAAVFIYFYPAAAVGDGIIWVGSSFVGEEKATALALRVRTGVFALQTCWCVYHLVCYSYEPRT